MACTAVAPLARFLVYLPAERGRRDAADPATHPHSVPRTGGGSGVPLGPFALRAAAGGRSAGEPEDQAKRATVSSPKRRGGVQPPARPGHLLSATYNPLVNDDAEQAPRIVPRSQHPISPSDIAKNALQVPYRLPKTGHPA